MTDAAGVTVTRYRAVRASAVLAFGGLALLAGVDVLALMVADRWRGDHALVDVAFWTLVAAGLLVVAGLVRAVAQIVRQPTVLRLDSTGYRVGRQSGSTGVRRARWSEVERVRRERRDDREYLVIQLRTGATTQVPVRAIAAPRQEVFAEFDARLNRAHGQRRLT